jgi:hypothetical protein
VRRYLLLSGVVATGILAGCGGTSTVTKTVSVTRTVRSTSDRSASITEFGHVRSLRRSAEGFELRFDPAWFLTGETANIAAAEDQGIKPGNPIPPVPNDNYVVDESHRLYTYRVAPTAHVSVLTQHGTGPLGETAITVSELARIVNGGKHRRLFEPIATGFWIVVEIDTVRSFRQQYQP